MSRVHGAALLIPPALVLGLCAWLHPATVDDAFITYRYARHWVEGLGLTYNAGQPPVEGYTNFLWLVIAAAGLQCGMDIVALLPLVGALCAAATCVVVSLTLKNLLEQGGAPVAGHLSAAWWVLPSLLLAANPLWSFWAISGLETPLVALGVTGGLCSVLVRCGQVHWSTPLWFLAAALARPDSILWAFVAGLWCLRVNPKRALVHFAMPFILIFGAYWLWRWLYFGAFWPNTFHDKTGAQGVLVLMGLRYMAWALLHNPLSLVLLWSLRWLPNLPTGERAGVKVALACIGIHLAYVVWIGGDGFSGDRFLMPALPTMALLLGWLFSSARITNHESRITIPAWAGITILMSTITPLLEYDAQESRPRIRGVFGKTIGQVRVGQWRWTTVGRWFDAHTPPGTRIALNPIGAIGFYAREALIIDMLGLTDPVIARGPVRHAWLAPGHRKGSGERVLELEPDFILINNVWLKTQPLENWALHYASESDLYERLPELLETYELRHFEVPPPEWPDDLPPAQPDGVRMLTLSALVKKAF